MIQFQSPEIGLRIRQDILNRRELQNVSRVTRAERKAPAAIDHRAPQSQCDRGDAVAELHRRHGVEIVRSSNSGKVRIKPRIVASTDHLLKNDRHLFFFQAVRRGPHVSFGMLAEGGSINPFDRFHELVEADREFALLVRQHEGLVYTGERLVLRILEQAGGAHSQRVIHFAEELEQLIANGGGQGGFEKALFNFGLVRAIQREISQIVLAQKAVKHIGGQYDRGRHGHSDARKHTRETMLLEQMPHEGQTARLTAQRSNTYPQKESIGRSQCRRTEVSNQDLTLFAAIVADRGDQIIAQVLGAGEVGNFPGTKFLGESKFGSRHQPMRKMIPLGVVGHAFRGHLLQHGFQAAEIARASNFRKIRQPENKITESKFFHEDAA